MGATEKTIVIFGAGKIGRSFVGQLFSRSGYQVLFVDVDKRVIEELNRRKSYDVVIKAEKDEVISVTNVCGILASDLEPVAEAIARCSLMATCVGKNALPKIMPAIAKGIEKRYRENPGYPIDIILAENVRDACSLVKESLISLLPGGFPVDSYLGLVETSIGKMVPIMPREIENADPLVVYAEPYNTLIVDKNGFKNPIPLVSGLSPKKNIKAWVDRKAFIHNLGHAVAAYYGFYKYPGKRYLYEVLEDPDVKEYTKQVMHQSAVILEALYPGDFTMKDLEAHISDLLSRFRNKALKDTLYRVGQDRLRKLGPDDRFVGMIRLARKQGMNYEKILEAMTYAFYFKATDETGKRFSGDLLFDDILSRGVVVALQNVCGFDPQVDEDLIDEFVQYYNRLCLKD
jgi:mannitol-1-phosphate 5-dehydrogenase